MHARHAACLDRDHRVAYILSEVFQIDSEQAATIKRLQRCTFAAVGTHKNEQNYDVVVVREAQQV